MHGGLEKLKPPMRRLKGGCIPGNSAGHGRRACYVDQGIAQDGLHHGGKDG